MDFSSVDVEISGYRWERSDGQHFTVIRRAEVIQGAGWRVLEAFGTYDEQPEYPVLDEVTINGESVMPKGTLKLKQVDVEAHLIPRTGQNPVLYLSISQE